MTWLRRRLLHCINLSGPYTGEVIFYCVCQSQINPRASSILRLRKRGGGRRDTSVLPHSSLPTRFSSFSLYLFPFLFIPYFWHQLICLFTHLTLTPITYLPPPLPVPHGGPNIFPRGAHLSQTLMNGSGSRIDFQTETI